MLTLHAGMRVHLALGTTDMRRGFDGLAAQVQTVLQADPFSGHLFLLRIHPAKAAGAERVGWAGIGDNPQLILDTPLAPTLDAADDFHPANPLRP